jgi:RimJ/RimL family protein N-acetyltransferase
MSSHDAEPAPAAERAADFGWGERLPTLAAPRVDLRWIEDADLPALFEIFSDPEVMRYWSSPPLDGPGAAVDLLREIRQHFKKRTFFQWGIARRADGLLLGTCTLFHLDAGNRRAEIGFALGRAHWRQGYVAEALGRLLEFAFGDLRLHRLEADVDPRNDPSLRTLERLGFRREGYLRERYHVNGDIQDTVMLGLLRREWSGARR